MRKVYIDNTPYIATDDIQFMSVEQLMLSACHRDKDKGCDACSLHNKCHREGTNMQFGQALMLGAIHKEIEDDRERCHLDVMTDEQLKEIYCGHYKQQHDCLYCSNTAACNKVIGLMREAQQAIFDPQKEK